MQYSVGCSLNVKVCNVAAIIAKICKIVFRLGGMIHSINIIIQVDFTACSGMLLIMIVTLIYILGLGLSTAGAYIASVHGCCSDWLSGTICGLGL